MSTDTNKRQTSFLLLYALQTIGVVLLVAVLIRVFFISSYAMSGESMIPSVLPGDFLLAQKLKSGRVDRGDLVVLRCPGNKDSVCLRRVIALEGDRVEFVKGRLTVNGTSSYERRLEGDQVAESIEGGAWSIWSEPISQPTELQPEVVPPQHVFVMNDRRGDKEDSRQWGSVPLDSVESRIFLVWLSLDWSEDGQVRSWPHVRWNRILRSLD